MSALYEPLAGRPETHMPYRRAALAFMHRELRRGLLRPLGGRAPGSPWWRAVNERLLRDTAESGTHSMGLGGPVSSSSAAHAVEFVEPPRSTPGTARTTPAPASIVAAYLDHRDLAATEPRVERFFINLVLTRVLYARSRLRSALGDELDGAAGSPIRTCDT